MSLVKILAACAVVLASTVAYAAEEYNEVKSVQDQVNDYRALRHACSVTRGEQRRVCFSQLRAATEDYKKAKKALALEKASSQQQLVGQVQP